MIASETRATTTSRRRSERRLDLPVVVTSVLDADDYPHVEAWLPKPFSGDGVQAALARALGDAP